MLIENEFEVPAPADRTWAFLLDVERVAPCAPGAELTETVDDRTWKGRVNVKVGPVAMAFAGTVTIQERDDDQRRVVLFAKGQETKGKGAASATVTTWLEERPAGSLVKVQADVAVSGTVAQLSRGLLPDVSRRLTSEFAECLRSRISAEPSVAADPGTPSPAPQSGSIGGVRLALWAAWRAIVRLVRRLFGRS